MKKNFKLVLALVLSLLLVASMTTAFAAVTISISRDDTTYEGQATADSRVLTWYKVFSADYGTDYTGDTAGGGYDDDGTPGAVTGDTDPVAYTATPAVAALLGTIDATTKAWTTNSGNQWFDLTYIPGTGNYSVAWRNDNAKSADDAQAAAEWLKTNNVYETGKTGTLTWNSGTQKWEATGLDKGYYIISSEAGDNLIAATTNIAIKEKNAYPPLDKTQADEDNTTQSDADRSVAVGDILTYQVKVSIPKTAKVGDKILVWDKASSGLEYVANSLKVESNVGNATVGETDATYVDSSWTWTKTITITSGSIGKDVIFEFQMKVTSDALVDGEKENESGLKYGRGEGTRPWPYESNPDRVIYETYFGGIEKVDGQDSTIKLENVEFTLKEGTAEFKVSKPSGKDYYVYDANGSSTVKTDANGLIKIRGLDHDKTYTLTETLNPNNGYNMVADPVTLTLYKDTTTTVTYNVATSYSASATYYTKNGNTYTEVEVDEATFNAAQEGTYYTKTVSETSYYDTVKTDPDYWQDVVNNKGAELPSTGGIGTTIFYVGGSILVLAAAILLITKRRMSSND